MNPLRAAEEANPSIKSTSYSKDIMGLAADVLIWYWRTGRVRTEMYNQLYKGYDMFTEGVPYAPREISVGISY